MCCLTMESAPWFSVGLSCNKRIITREYPKLKMHLAQHTCKQAWLYHEENLLLLSPPLWLLGDRVGMSHYTVLHRRKVCYSCSLGKITIRNFSYSFNEYIFLSLCFKIVSNPKFGGICLICIRKPGRNDYSYLFSLWLALFCNFLYYLVIETA